MGAVTLNSFNGHIFLTTVIFSLFLSGCSESSVAEERFQSEVLKACVRYHMENNNGIELKTISELDCGTKFHAWYQKKTRNLDSRISSLAGIEQLIGLKTLNLPKHQISDLTPLSALTSLQTLNLNFNHVTSLSPLANLTALETLKIDVAEHSMEAFMATRQGEPSAVAQISDISPLLNLTKLTHLNLSGHNISDLSVLTGKDRLKELILTKNPIAQLDAIAQLRSLVELNIANAQISEIPEHQWHNLESLILYKNKLSDVTRLQSLVQLKVLSLSENNLVDIAVLGKLKGLQKLFLDNNQIESVASLNDLTQLESLSLKNNKLTKLIALSKLTKLSGLDLSGNRITDVSELDVTDLDEFLRINLLRNPIDCQTFSQLSELTKRKVLLDERQCD